MIFLAGSGGGESDLTDTATIRVNPGISPNKITWEMQELAEACFAKQVIWVSELSLFVACFIDGTQGIQTSPDGETWTLRNTSSISVQSIAWSASLGLLVGVANSGSNRVLTSPDGINWTPQDVSEASLWRSVAWSPTLGLFVAVASSGTNRLMTSANGVDWSFSNVLGTTIGWWSVDWSPTLGVFCAACTSGVTFGSQQPLAVSVDGTTWTYAHYELNVFGTSTVVLYQQVYWSPLLSSFIFTSVSQGAATTPDSYKACVLTSEDLVSFKKRPITLNAQLNVPFDGEDLVIVPGGKCAANIVTSEDGVNWFNETPANSVEYVTGAYSPTLDVYVVLGDNRYGQKGAMSGTRVV
jgi:hypothetical protein